MNEKDEKILAKLKGKLSLVKALQQAERISPGEPVKPQEQDSYRHRFTVAGKEEEE